MFTKMVVLVLAGLLGQGFLTNPEDPLELLFQFLLAAGYHLAMFTISMLLWFAIAYHVIVSDAKAITKWLILILWFAVPFIFLEYEK